MPNLLAMSFEGELAPSFDLRCLRSGQTLPDGWGLGYYPAGEPSASVLKEPAPSQGSIRGELVKAWEHLESSLFVLHVRTATWGSNTDANTQPFVRSWAGREWMIGHAGTLAHTLEPPSDSRFEPVGATDTERVFCTLLERIAARGWRSLDDADLKIVARVAHRAQRARVARSRALTMAATPRLCGPVRPETLHLGELLPPYAKLVIGDDDVEIDLDEPWQERAQGDRRLVLRAQERGLGPPISGAGFARASSWSCARGRSSETWRRKSLPGMSRSQSMRFTRAPIAAKPPWPRRCGCRSSTGPCTRMPIRWSGAPTCYVCPRFTTVYRLC